MRRGFYTLLAVAMLMVVLPASGEEWEATTNLLSAQEEAALLANTPPVDEDLIMYDSIQDSDGVWIRGVDSTAHVIRIPEEVNGSPVTALSIALNTPREATIRTLILPASLTEISFDYESEPQGNLEYVIVDPANETYCSQGGVVFTKDKKTLIFCPYSINDRYSYRIPDGVERVEVNAFASWHTVYIPASVTEFAMQGETDYDVNIVGGVVVDEANPVYTTLGGMLVKKQTGALCFCPPNCMELIEDISRQRFTIAQGVTSVEKNAFCYAPQYDLYEIFIPESLTSIADNTTWGEELQNWFYLTNISVSPDNPAYATLNGSLVSKDGKTLYFMACEQGKSREFDMDEAYDVAEIPQGIEVVENDAISVFWNIQVPASVKKLGLDFDYNNNDWREIHVDPDNPVYASIDGVLFSADKKTLLRVPGWYRGEYTVPTGTTTIAESAFYGFYREIQSVVLPETVTACYSAITETYVTFEIPATVTDVGERVFVQPANDHMTAVFSGTLVTPEGSAADKLYQKMSAEYPELSSYVTIRRP